MTGHVRAKWAQPIDGDEDTRHSFLYDCSLEQFLHVMKRALAEGAAEVHIHLEPASVTP